MFDNTFDGIQFILHGKTPKSHPPRFKCSGVLIIPSTSADDTERNKLNTSVFEEINFEEIKTNDETTTR